MGRILVYPQLLEQLGRAVNEASMKMEQLNERLNRSVRHIPWESADKARIEQRLIELNQLSEAIVSRLESNSQYLSKKAKEFADTDHDLAQSIGMSKMGVAAGSLGALASYYALNSQLSKMNGKQAVVSKPKITVDSMVPFGVSPDKWKENPVGSGPTAAGIVKDGLDAKKSRGLYGNGFYANQYTNKQGKEMVRVKNRTLLKEGQGRNVVRKTKISLEEARTIPEVNRVISPASSLMKDSLKLKNNAWGYVSTGLDIYKDTVKNIKDDAGVNKIIGNEAGDVVVGAGTSAGSTYVGTAIDMMVGGPVGAAIGVDVGFALSVGGNCIFEGIEFRDADWDGNKEFDTVKDRIKVFLGNPIDTAKRTFH